MAADIEVLATTGAGQSANARRKNFRRHSIFDYEAVRRALQAEGISMSHAYKTWRYIITWGLEDYSDIPQLPKKLVKLFNEKFDLLTTRVAQQKTSKDGTTTKLVFELQDKQHVEAVIMRYGQMKLDSLPVELSQTPSPQESYKSQPRATLCVSSQSGCSMNCAFCATGKMGLRGNLTSGEILEQLFIANRIEPIRNVVFMGMGEPLDNYKEVVDAVNMMACPKVFGLSYHRITVSTVGVVPRIRQLKKDLPNVCLALSLHAPTQELRESLVPSAMAYKLPSILTAAIDFIKSQHAQPSRVLKQQFLLVEYVMIKDVNSDAETARQLRELLEPISQMILVNLIPCNPTQGDHNFGPPTQQEIDTFLQILRERKIRTIVRQTFGQDIQGACGQLAITHKSTPPLTSSVVAILSRVKWVYPVAVGVALGFVALRLWRPRR